MKVLDVLIKLIEVLGMIPSQDLAQLKTDCKDWEDSCHKATEKEKFKQLYQKLHKGVWTRVLMTFAFWFLLSKMKRLMSPEMSEDFLD